MHDRQSRDFAKRRGRRTRRFRDRVADLRVADLLDVRDEEADFAGCLDKALKAADSLAEEGINARVIDCYSIKPIDGETLAAAAEETGHIVTVEDHWPEGGLGEAVLSALAERGARADVARLAVKEMPHSGKPEELLAAFEIDAEAIAKAAKQLVRSGSVTTA